MVGQMGKEPKTVKSVIALLLVLEELGSPGLIRLVQAHSNDTIEALFKEGLLCLECLRPNAIEPSSDDIPVLASLFDEPMNRRFFHYHREFMYKRHMDIMEAVCGKIFGETAALEADASDMELVVRPFGEETSALFPAQTLVRGSPSRQGSGSAPWQSGMIASKEDAIAQSMGQKMVADDTPTHKTPVKSSLNPNASEFFLEQVPEAARTMFLTFSSGSPLSRQEITHFFTSNWGIIVKDVSIEKVRKGVSPLFGKVIFTTSLVIPRILGGRNIAKFMVNGRHLWLRSFTPQRRKSEGNRPI
ncbi:unnamed protein product [Dovyalis caffra]|uniref:Uncharacterized protein n=1 Tax=Dovyalis caffra TaxID=77055 RepID=A0AAV1SUT8_9ROSI|nr:unnamed protein product [Dovyalis caffra]